MDKIILNYFKMPLNKIDLSEWENLIDRVDSLEQEITVAVIGEFVNYMTLIYRLMKR